MNITIKQQISNRLTFDMVISRIDHKYADCEYQYVWHLKYLDSIIITKTDRGNKTIFNNLAWEFSNAVNEVQEELCLFHKSVLGDRQPQFGDSSFMNSINWVLVKI